MSVSDELLKKILQSISDNESNSTKISDEIKKILENYTITKKKLLSTPDNFGSSSSPTTIKYIKKSDNNNSDDISHSMSFSWAELDDYDDYRQLSSSAPPDYKPHSDQNTNSIDIKSKSSEIKIRKEKTKDKEKNENLNEKVVKVKDENLGESESPFKRIFIRIPSIQTKFNSDAHIYSVSSKYIAEQIGIDSELYEYSELENMDSISDSDLLNWYNDRKKLHEYQSLYVMGDFVYTTHIFNEV